MASIDIPVKGQLVVIPNLMSEQKVRLPLRIPASLKAKLTELAKREHRSVNKQIEFMLEWAIQAGIHEEARELLRPRAEHGKRK
jgi:hypothetical protein